VPVLDIPAFDRKMSATEYKMLFKQHMEKEERALEGYNRDKEKNIERIEGNLHKE